jgi:8-oxo-dGTP diphosphatase
MAVVAGALRRDDGRWLLHRRPPHKDHGGLWEFPGGKVERGETPGSALIRELSEELGIKLRPACLAPFAFAESAPHDGLPGLVVMLYTIAQWHGEPQALEPGAELAWCTLPEVAQMSKPPLDIELSRRLIATFAGKVGS